MLKNIYIFLTILLLFFSFTSFVSADCSGTGGADCFPNPLNVTDPKIIIKNVIQAALGLTGSIALVMFVYGGFVWMTAAGKAESITKGKNILIWAAIGLIVIFTSYVVLKFVFTDIIGAGTLPSV